MSEIEDKKRKLPIWAKIVIAAGGVSVLLLAVFLLTDTRSFGDYKRFLSRTVNSIANDKERTDTVEGKVVENEGFDEMEKKLPFKLSKPVWMPEEYMLDYADYSDFGNDIYVVTYNYINPADETKNVSFTVSTVLDFDPSDGMTDAFEKVEVNGMDVYLTEIDDGESCTAQFINDQGFQAGINGTVSKETLIKIIENMS